MSALYPVAACIVSYNSRDHLRRCLAALGGQGLAQLVVVDNASTDGTIEMLGTEFPQVRAILNGRNRGYGPAANQGIRETTTPYALLLNPDTVSEPGTVSQLAAYAKRHPEAAVIGPRIVNPDGTLQPSCYPEPTPLNVLIDSSGLSPLLARLPGAGRLSVRWWDHRRPRRVRWLLGAALLIERETFDRLGGFDEQFPLYYEETDYCARCWAFGREVHFAPFATVAHVGGGSSPDAPDGVWRRWQTGARRYYRKHYGKLRLLQLEVVLRLVGGARRIGALARACHGLVR